MVSKAEAAKSATNVEGGDSNPNEIAKFIDFKAKRVTVYTTEAAQKHYPKIGTAVELTPTKAEKWIEKGYASAEAPVPSAPNSRGKKEA